MSTNQLVLTKGATFYAVNNKGEYWKPDPSYKSQYIAIAQDDEKNLIAIVVSDLNKYGHSVYPLIGYRITMEPPPADENPIIYTKVECPRCFGRGTVSEIVDHNSDGAVYEDEMCGKGHGSGKVVSTPKRSIDK